MIRRHWKGCHQVQYLVTRVSTYSTYLGRIMHPNAEDFIFLERHGSRACHTFLASLKMIAIVSHSFVFCANFDYSGSLKKATVTRRLSAATTTTTIRTAGKAFHPARHKLQRLHSFLSLCSFLELYFELALRFAL